MSIENAEQEGPNLQDEGDSGSEVINRSLSLSIWDGAFATMMFSLCGGIFLVGFALTILDASALQVGILAALPVSANIAQVLGSIFIERYGYRRKWTIVSVTLGRLFWLPVILLPLAIFAGWGDTRVWLLVVFVGAASLLGSLAGVGWLGWMSDVVPPATRGTFFAKRNKICAGAGMVVILGGGYFLNFWEDLRGRDDPYGYLFLFSLGLVLGLISSYLLYCITDPKEGPAPPEAKKNFRWSGLWRPFQDRNFRRLIVYVALFMFVTQMAGPFYAVYMIDSLKIDFGTITLLITFATLASLFMLKIWGAISDQFGNKPILLVAGAAHALIPLVWVVAQGAVYYEALVIAHILSGGIYCAILLAHLNILIKLSPEQGRSFYISAFNTVMGLSVVIAPIVGGLFLEWTAGATATVGTWEINNLHVLFLLSGALQFAVLFSLLGLREEGSSPSRQVIMQLRNDLNPQTGLASATDFISVRAGQTNRFLKTIDKRTDDWAARSEAFIGRLWDRLEAKARKSGKPNQSESDNSEQP
ncbi:MAG: MFS transporter [Opitutales bacterium]|nr:MFS transporter [Opitutales bacterium]MCH8541336.1 MFS transporter [Opitutales bacterium]